MPRKRSQVKEDASDLKRIELEVAGSRREPAVRMLRFLAESPGRTLSEVAEIMNRPERTVRRWWQFYLAGGLDVLLQAPPAGGQRPSKLTADELAAFRARAASGFSELKEAQQWLVQEYGVSYSLGRVSELLKESSSALPDQDILSQIEGCDTTTVASPNVDLVSFLNALPTSVDSVKWIQEFSQLLMRLLGDVDRISVNVNTRIDISGNSAPTAVRFIQYPSVGHDSSSMVSCVPYDSESPPSRQLLEDYTRNGCPIHLYQEPAALDYFTTAENEYLGSLILWRFKDQEPTSPDTLALLRQLRPFIIFAFTDVIARTQCRYPDHQAFHSSLSTLAQEANLTLQEYRIVGLRLLGHSYREIAEMLFVSIGTIKKHLNRVHHKSQTRSQNELFARYFSSRIWA